MRQQSISIIRIKGRTKIRCARADFGTRKMLSYSHHKKQASNLRKTGGQDKMEKFIYWIKRTLHHSKHCNSLCIRFESGDGTTVNLHFVDVDKIEESLQELRSLLEAGE